MSTPPPYMLDMAEALRLIDHARAVVESLHGTAHNDRNVRSASIIAANQNKEILHAVHQLRRASMAVEVQYWAGRGFVEDSTEHA